MGENVRVADKYDREPGDINGWAVERVSVDAPRQRHQGGGGGG